MQPNVQQHFIWNVFCNGYTLHPALAVELDSYRVFALHTEAAWCNKVQI